MAIYESDVFIMTWLILSVSQVLPAVDERKLNKYFACTVKHLVPLGND